MMVRISGLTSALRGIVEESTSPRVHESNFEMKIENFSLLAIRYFSCFRINEQMSVHYILKNNEKFYFSVFFFPFFPKS
jgi:hypothetical protein